MVPWVMTASQQSLRIGTLGPLNLPMGIVVDKTGDIYVSCFSDSSVQIFNSDYELKGELRHPLMKGPHNVFFGPNNEVFVCDYARGGILKFKPNYQFSGEVIAGSPLEGLCDAKIDSEGLIVAVNFTQSTILKMKLNGEIVGWLGARHGKIQNTWNTDYVGASYSMEFGGFDRPGGLDFDRDGNIYVADTYNHRIQRFSSSGEFTGWLGWSRGQRDAESTRFRMDGSQEPTLIAGGLQFPSSVRIYDDVILTTEVGNHRVQAFDLSGNFLGWIGARIETLRAVDSWVQDGFAMASRNSGGFVQPYGTAVANGNLLVADAYNFRVQVIFDVMKELKALKLKTLSASHAITSTEKAPTQVAYPS